MYQSNLLKNLYQEQQKVKIKKINIFERWVIHSLYQAKEITKKVYNNMMNPVKSQYKNEYYIYEF